MNKGISAIIATILLLLITIALAGTAYLFISGMLSGKTDKAVSIMSVECTRAEVDHDGDTVFETERNITIVISHDGTEPIDMGNEIQVLINNADATSGFQDKDSSGNDLEFTGTLEPHKTAVGTSDDVKTSGVHKVLVKSPSTAVNTEVYCT